MAGRRQKYDHAEIERRYVELGQPPEEIAAAFAPDRDSRDYKLALKRIREIVKQKNLPEIQQGVRAIEPKVKAKIKDRRQQLLKIATDEYTWAMAQIALLRGRLGKDADGQERELTAAEIDQQLNLLDKAISGLEKIGLGLAPAPIDPTGLGVAGILAAAAGRIPDSPAESERLVVLYERLKQVTANPTPPGFVSQDDKDDKDDAD